MWQFNKTWTRWGAGFVVMVLAMEVAMLQIPVASTVKQSLDQAWRLPILVDRSQLLALSEAAAANSAWGLEEGKGEIATEAASWQLKGVIKVGSQLLALVAVGNKISRLAVGDQVLDEKIVKVEETGVTVSGLNDKGQPQARFVKIHR